MKKILIVEDNVEMISYLSGLFSENYSVESAQNGMEGLECLNKSSFNLIIADVMMPQMNGFEMLEAIRKNTNYKHIPVIMLTSLQEEKHMIHALSIGVDDYLNKPFSPNELIARVNNMIVRSEIRSSENVIEEKEEGPSWGTIKNLQFIEKVEEIVKSELENEEFRVEHLAANFNLGERQFRRKMKLITGLSPKEFQHEVALQTSRELLECHQYDNISAVAYTVGIRNSTRFATLYEKRFGKDPRSFFDFNKEFPVQLPYHSK